MHQGTTKNRSGIHCPHRQPRSIMDDSPSATALMPNVRIGIPGLPHLTNSMVQGGLYVLIADTASARFPLFASSLGASLKDGRRCTAIVPSNPEHFIQRLETLGDLKAQGLLATEQFRLYVMQDEFSKKMFRFGAERFVSELEQFELPQNSFLVFDQADDLISLHDVSLAIEQVDILSKWLAQHQVTALLTFLRVTESHTGTINALMDYLTGIARLGGDEDGLRLGFDYWQSPDGTVAARHFHLLTKENNCYEAVIKSSAGDAPANDSPVAEQDIPPEDPITSYYYMDPDLGSLSTQMPGNWQRVDTLVGMMHATRNQRRAVAIFCYKSDTNLRQLAEAIHTMRINLGKYAQIVVQEKHASLRYQNEALLLRLGVNLVVHRDVQAARMPLMLGSVVGQIFNRDVDINFEAAMSSVSASAQRGYLLPSRFAREVEALQDRAATLNIPYALIIGHPCHGVDMLEILNRIKLSRPGDLVTADNDACYLFFNACQQSVILPTLERLLGCSVDSVFSEVRFQVSREEMGHDIAALLHNAQAGLAVDYTAMIAAPAPVSVPVLPAVGDTGTSSPAATAAQWSASPSMPPEVSGGPLHSALASAPIAQAGAAPPTAAAHESDSAAELSLYARTMPPPPPVFGKREAPRATRSAKRPKEAEAD